MRKNRFVTGVVLGIGLAVASGRVEAKEKPFHAPFAGTITNKDDFSFTGTPGGSSYETIAGKSTLGAYTAQAVAELRPDSNTCPLQGGGSGVEFVVNGDVVVLSFLERGDSLFLHLSPLGQLACQDPATGAFSGQITFDVSGGTGRFAGATGTIVKIYKTILLAAPPASPPGTGFFVSFTGTFDGTIESAD